MNIKIINFAKKNFWINQFLVFIASGLFVYRYPVACIKGIIFFCIFQAIALQTIKMTEENKSLTTKYFLGFCVSCFFAILTYEYFFGITTIPESW